MILLPRQLTRGPSFETLYLILSVAINPALKRSVKKSRSRIAVLKWYFQLRMVAWKDPVGLNQSNNRWRSNAARVQFAVWARDNNFIPWSRHFPIVFKHSQLIVMIMVTIRMMMTMMTWAVDTSVEKLLPLSRQFVGNLLFPGTPS